MKIQITLHRTHPHFGGHETITWRFAMSEGVSAQAKYLDLAKEVEASRGHTFVEIGVVLDGEHMDYRKAQP